MEVVEKSFSGSLPNFIAAFARTKTLTRKEVDEIQKIIDAYKD